MKTRLNSHTISEILARKNQSQNWLAKQVETTSGYLSQLISGFRSPSPKMRQKILNVFNDCKFDDLFTLETNKHVGKRPIKRKHLVKKST